MGQRGNGEGSIYRRTDGRWCGQVIIGKKRRTIYGRTRRDVQVKLRKLLADADRGVWSSPQRFTVAEYLDRWLEDTARPSVKKRTWEGYVDIVRVHLLPALGSFKLTSLQPSHIQKLYSSLLAKGLTPKTVRNSTASSIAPSRKRLPGISCPATRRKPCAYPKASPPR